MTEHYPNIDELLQIAESTKVTIPEELMTRLRTRFAGSKDAYATEARTKDGRIVNACMMKDSYQDMEEEIVDAVFNAMVAALKKYPNSQLLLGMVVTMWNMIHNAMTGHEHESIITLQEQLIKNMMSASWQPLPLHS